MALNVIHELLDDLTYQVGSHTDRWFQTLLITSLLKFSYPPCYCTGLDSNQDEGMDVFKCIITSRHGGTLNSRRAASPLAKLVEEEERSEALDKTQGVLPQNWDGTKKNRILTCKVLEDKNLALSRDEFRGS
ncbi:uncharacterized protein TNCV_2989261 [Trichonephila clavipes]|nr:uncharacterized protein TNCV_2989261 [Trichonephila clavipes]